MHSGIEKSVEGGSHPSGSASSRLRGDIRHCNILQTFTIAGKSRIEQTDILGRGSFLRPEYSRRAIRSYKRIINIAHHRERAFQNIRSRFGCIDIIQEPEGGTSLRQVITGTVEETNSQSTQHSGASVVGGAPADTDYKMPTTGIEGVVYQFAGSARRRNARIALVGSKQCQTTRLCHFNDCGLHAVYTDYTVGGLYRPPQRVRNLSVHISAVESVDEHMHRALPSISHGDTHHLRVRQNTQDSSLSRLGNIGRRQRTLERVACNYNLFPYNDTIHRIT